MITADSNTWILGLDLGDRSRGAIRFADWLSDPEHIVAVHVMELWSRPYLRADAVPAVHETVRRIARELEVAQPARISVIDADSAEEGLTHVAAGAAGLVIGRAAGSREATLAALGHVARRLLRRLPCPVVVVPRDLAAVAPGPILLATDLDTSSQAAVGFARALAARHGREIEVVHVREDRHSDLIDDLDPSWLAAREAASGELEHALHRWMAEHALLGRPHVVQGSTVEALHAAAVAMQAAMIVVGSRRLGAIGRIFLGSTASALAGQAVCPVAVVPAS